jgi:hypothetical protein
MDHPDDIDDDLARGRAWGDRLFEAARTGDLGACRTLARELRAAGLGHLAEPIEALCDPATARRVATLIELERYPDDPL